MKNYLCDICEERWKSDNPHCECPKCGEKFEIRKTMSIEEAKKIGLTE